MGCEALDRRVARGLAGRVGDERAAVVREGPNGSRWTPGAARRDLYRGGLRTARGRDEARIRGVGP